MFRQENSEVRWSSQASFVDFETSCAVYSNAAAKLERESGWLMIVSWLVFCVILISVSMAPWPIWAMCIGIGFALVGYLYWRVREAGKVCRQAMMRVRKPASAEHRRQCEVN